MIYNMINVNCNSIQRSQMFYIQSYNELNFDMSQKQHLRLLKYQICTVHTYVFRMKAAL